MRLILQMIDVEEKVRTKPKKSKNNRGKSYSGNLVQLRKRREKMLMKKHKLNLEIKDYEKMTSFARDSIFKNIEELSFEIERINKEILKVQQAMQNSNNWLDGSYTA